MTGFRQKTGRGQSGGDQHISSELVGGLVLGTGRVGRPADPFLSVADLSTISLTVGLMVDIHLSGTAKDGKGWILPCI